MRAARYRALAPHGAIVMPRVVACLMRTGRAAVGWPAGTRPRQTGIPTAHVCAVRWRDRGGPGVTPYIPLVDTDWRQLAPEKGVFHQLAAAVQVLFHASLGCGRVATRDGVDNLEVRGGCALLKGTELHAE